MILRLYEITPHCVTLETGLCAMFVWDKERTANAG